MSEHTFPPRGDEVITPVACADAEGGGAVPTTANVDSIAMTSAGTVVVVGEIGPGRSPEQGAADIEIALDGPSVSIIPPAGDSELVFGRNPANREIGVNLNAGDESGANDDADLIFASPLAALVLAQDGRNVITGAGGGDLPRAFPGTLSAYGGKGRDELTAGVGPVGFFSSSGGEDVLRGGPGEDELNGGGGRDRVVGGGGDDIIDGNRADDRLRGRGGDDEIEGSYGNDRMSGGRGRDSLLGGVGDDLLLARDGLRDRLVSCWHGSDKREAARVDGKDPRPLSC